MATPLAALLAPKLTVVNYDRRGRGKSGDAKEYAVEREVEDLAALIQECGGTASLYGASSGAVLAIETAARKPELVRRVVLYEPPFIVDATRTPVADDFLDRVKKMLADGKRSEAVETFMVEAVLVPPQAVAQMKKAPLWSGLEQLAPTLAYDGEILGSTLSGKPLPKERWAGATMPVLVVAGGKSPPWLRNGASALAEVLADAESRTLDGQEHAVAPAAIAPVIEEFLSQE
jgi:pimeloyl-ACP methyl ester carboxylesterase